MLNSQPLLFFHLKKSLISLIWFRLGWRKEIQRQSTRQKISWWPSRIEQERTCWKQTSFTRTKLPQLKIDICWSSRKVTKKWFKVVSLLPKNCLAESRCREKPGGPSSIPGLEPFRAAARPRQIVGRRCSEESHGCACKMPIRRARASFMIQVLGCSIHLHFLNCPLAWCAGKIKIHNKHPFSCECEDGDSHVDNSVLSKQLTIHPYWTHPFNSVIFWLAKKST